jgi:2-polyprenyl-3-methyl-5-hydroxy-6-metoxy-1,4-benzoquinol methylase
MADRTQYSNEVWKFFDSQPDDGFEDPGCIFCGKDQGIELFKKNSMRVTRCRCGFVYNSRQPTQSVLNRFYKESQAMDSWAEIKQSSGEDRRQEEKFEKAAEFILQSDITSVLDIGCGNGYFLSMLKERSKKLRLHGIETHPAAVKIAQRNGLVVNADSIESFLEKNEATFDCMSMWGVLEHIKAPVETLKSLSHSLKAGGHMIVCVPNVDSAVVQALWSECFTFCPQHLWYFDAPNLQAAFANAGFELKNWWTIEPEMAPILRHRWGFPAYGALPEWTRHYYDSESLSHGMSKKMILGHRLGYKIVAVAQKKSTKEKLIA